jgi:hypothetical protein
VTVIAGSGEGAACGSERAEACTGGHGWDAGHVVWTVELAGLVAAEDGVDVVAERYCCTLD